MKNLTQHLDTSAWRLYELIKHNSAVEGRKTTQKEICDTLSEYGFVWNSDEKAHDHCSRVNAVIHQINNSWEIDKVIIAKNFEYWIGNEEETQEYLDSLWSQLAPRLYRFWNYKSKLARNGQGKILSNRLEPITDNSKAREFIESYLNADTSI